MPTLTRTGTLTLAFAALLGLASTGCGSVYNGQHSTSMHFLVEPANGTFAGWSAVDLGFDVSSVDSASLWGCSLAVENPPPNDLSFLSSVTGESNGTPLASLSSFPAGEPNASMNILYYGDLKPLFESSSKIQINWSGTLNPDFTAWPSGGIWVTANVTVNVQ
jgi:hypothetical protein